MKEERRPFLLALCVMFLWLHHTESYTTPTNTHLYTDTVYTHTRPLAKEQK